MSDEIAIIRIIGLAAVLLSVSGFYRWHIASDWAQVNIFGLDKSDSGDYGHALIHVEMQSPSLLLGTPLGIESGLLGVFIQLLGIVLLLLWASYNKRPIDWNAKMDIDGKPVNGGKHS